MLTESSWIRPIAPKSAERDYMAAVRRRVRQALCRVHGHDLMLHFERGRICLRCTDCGYETSGWSLN